MGLIRLLHGKTPAVLLCNVLCRSQCLQEYSEMRTLSTRYRRRSYGARCSRVKIEQTTALDESSPGADSLLQGWNEEESEVLGFEPKMEPYSLAVNQRRQQQVPAPLMLPRKVNRDPARVRRPSVEHKTTVSATRQALNKSTSSDATRTAKDVKQEEEEGIKNRPVRASSRQRGACKKTDLPLVIKRAMELAPSSTPPELYADMLPSFSCQTVQPCIKLEVTLLSILFFVFLVRQLLCCVQIHSMWDKELNRVSPEALDNELSLSGQKLHVGSLWMANRKKKDK